MSHRGDRTSASRPFQRDYMWGSVSFFENRTPVQNYSRRRGFRFAAERSNQKSLAVGRNVVLVKIGYPRQHPSFEKRFWRGELKFCSAGFHGRRHHLSVGGDKEEFAPVAPPDGESAAVCRDALFICTQFAV